MEDKIFEECLDYYMNSKGAYWKPLAEKHGFPNAEAIRCKFKDERIKRGIPSKTGFETSSKREVLDEDGEIKYSEKEEIKADGSVYSDKLIRMSEEEKRSPTRLLELHGFDPDLWEIVSCTNNLWHAMRKNDLGRLLQYQSKLTAKPKSGNKITFSDIDRFFENHAYKNINIHKSSFSKKNDSGKILEITIPDLHFGKRDIENNKSMEERLSDISEDISSKIKNVKIDKIIFAFLGDIIHFDSKSLSTTHGTHLETNGDNFQETFDRALSSSLSFIDEFINVSPIENVFVSGNHDYISSYMLSKSIELYYRNNNHVQCDVSHSSRKYRRIGDSLLGLCHGNLPKKNMFDWINYEARNLISSTKRTELHCGHLHSEQVIEQGSTTLRHLPTISGTDEWSYEKGYVGSQNRIFSFLWDYERGIDQIWMSYFE